MTDVVKMCDVIDNCTECPKYGDDCDGDKRLYTHEEAWGMCDLISRADAMSKCKNAENELTDEAERRGVRVARFIIGELPSAKYITEKPNDAVKPSNDVINRADAIEAVEFVNKHYSNEKLGYVRGLIKNRLMALPSADAVDCTDFIEWLVDRVLDETIWENNSVAYGEIICRKLEKLGILEVTEEPSYYIRPSAEAVQGGRYENAMQKLREMPRYLNGVKAKQIKKIPSEAECKSAHPMKDALRMAIEALTDRPQGEWKWSNGGQCSECGFHNSNFDYNFCPNCGADMTPHGFSADELYRNTFKDGDAE